jgi:hypothetical protein
MRRSKILFLVTLIFCLTFTGRDDKIQAADPITLISHSVESKYRESITFHASAKSNAGKITSYQVILKDFFGLPRVLLCNGAPIPAEQLDLECTWDTSKGIFPPWLSFTYIWEITDSARNILKTPDLQGEYADETHPWKSLEDERVKVYWYSNEDGANILAAAQAGFKHVAELTGFTPQSQIRIVFYSNANDYRTVFPDTPAHLGRFAGLSFGPIIVQFLGGGGGTSLKSVVPHELGHSFLFFRLANKRADIPTWFNEGQASNCEPQDYIDDALYVARRLAFSGKLIPLADMDQRYTELVMYNKSVDWYSQSSSMITFLYETFGTDSLGQIVDEMNQGKVFDEAFQAVTGWTLDIFELQWKAWLMRNPPTPTAVDHSVITVEPIFPPTPDYSATAAP